MICDMSHMHAVTVLLNCNELKYIEQQMVVTHSGVGIGTSVVVQCNPAIAGSSLTLHWLPFQ